MIPNVEKIYTKVAEVTKKLRADRQIAYLQPSEISRELEELQKKFGL